MKMMVVIMIMLARKELSRGGKSYVGEESLFSTETGRINLQQLLTCLSFVFNTMQCNATMSNNTMQYNAMQCNVTMSNNTMQCLWFWNQLRKCHIGLVSKLFMHGSLNIKNRIINAPKWVQWSTTTSPARLCESIRLSGQNQLRLIEREYGSIILFHWKDWLGKWRFCRTFQGLK